MSVDSLQQFLIFNLNEERYGIEILRTKEVMEYPDSITAIPNTPKFVMGMYNLRGRIIPIVDLRLKFGMKAHYEKEKTVIIFVRHIEKIMGVVVDCMSEVSMIVEENIQDSPEFGGGVDLSFVSGIYNDKDDQLISLLDLDRILTADEIESINPNNKANHATATN